MKKPKFNQNYKGLRFRVCLVREGKPAEPIRIENADDVYDLVKDELINSDRERLLSVMLTASNHLIGVETVSIGNLYSTDMSPREAFKSAILSNSASIVLCHNHPSGDLNPSKEDIRMTKIFIEAGELLKINVFDHLIVSADGYISLRDHCKFPN